jgi:hypothetical protein
MTSVKLKRRAEVPTNDNPKPVQSWNLSYSDNLTVNALTCAQMYGLFLDMSLLVATAALNATWLALSVSINVLYA